MRCRNGNTPEGGLGGGSGTVREGTQASSGGGPAVRTLPDTAVSTATTSVLLLAGIVLLAGSSTVAVAVRNERSRRR